MSVSCGLGHFRSCLLFGLLYWYSYLDYRCLHFDGKASAHLLVGDSVISARVLLFLEGISENSSEGFFHGC